MTNSSLSESLLGGLAQPMWGEMRMSSPWAAFFPDTGAA